MDFGKKDTKFRDERIRMEFSTEKLNENIIFYKTGETNGSGYVKIPSRYSALINI